MPVTIARLMRRPVREGNATVKNGARNRAGVTLAITFAAIVAHLDVREAAVLSLTRWSREPAARDALGIALKDSDADVGDGRS